MRQKNYMHYTKPPEVDCEWPSMGRLRITAQAIIGPSGIFKMRRPVHIIKLNQLAIFGYTLQFFVMHVKQCSMLRLNCIMPLCIKQDHK